MLCDHNHHYHYSNVVKYRRAMCKLVAKQQTANHKYIFINTFFNHLKKLCTAC